MMVPSTANGSGIVPQLPMLLDYVQRRRESFMRREQANIDRIQQLEVELGQQGQQREADIAAGRDEFGTKGAVIRCPGPSQQISLVIPIRKDIHDQVVIIARLISVWGLMNFN